MGYVQAFIFVLLSVKIIAYKIAVDVHNYGDCPGYPPLIDFSFLEFNLEDDGNIIINGNFTVLKEIADPFPLHIRLEKLQRGEWREVVGDRQVKNFCQTLNSSYEVWYPAIKYLNKHSCPFPVGYVGRFDNFFYGELPMIIPPNLIGEWRAYMEQRDSAIHKEPLGCAMQRVSVFEV